MLLRVNKCLHLLLVLNLFASLHLHLHLAQHVSRLVQLLDLPVTEQREMRQALLDLLAFQILPIKGLSRDCSRRGTCWPLLSVISCVILRFVYPGGRAQ